MAETFARGGRVYTAPLGTSDWTPLPVSGFCWSGIVPKAALDAAAEQESQALRKTIVGRTISFDFTMTRRDLRRMIRMLHIRRSPAAVRQSAMHSVRQSAMHSEYHRRQKRRNRR